MARVKIQDLPLLELVVKHGLGSRASAERDLARIEARGGQPTPVKGAKIRAVE